MNHQIISETLKRSTLRQSLNLAIIVAAALIFLVPQSAFAQGSGTSILLPMIVSGTDNTIPSNIPEFNIEDIDINDIAQSQDDGEISALYRCTHAGSRVAWSGPVKKTYVSYNDPGNGVLQYAYALSQEIDYFVYVQCGSTYYKYRVYGDRLGSQECNGYKAFISWPMTCQPQRWNSWQRTSGYGYQGSGSNPWF